MLIPHLHFNGNCKEAISFYEKAFNVKADCVIYESDYAPADGKNGARVAHAEMHIHGHKIYLNDRFGKKDTSTDIAVHLIVTFQNKTDLLSCYEKMKENVLPLTLWNPCHIVRSQFNLLINSECSGDLWLMKTQRGKPITFKYGI